MTVGSIISQALSRDTFMLEKIKNGIDDEGFPVQGFIPLDSKRGTWGTPLSTDIETAGRMGQTVQAVCATKLDVVAEIGDKFSGLRGKDWIVTHVRTTVVSNRYFLREA